VSDHFDFAEDRRGALLNLRRRFERPPFAERVRHEEAQLPHRAQLTGQPLWKRFISYLISLQRLTWTRRQAAILEDEVKALRRAIVLVSESELTAATDGIVILQEALIDLGQRVTDLAAQTAAELQGSAAAATERLAAADRALEDVRHRLQFERLTRQKAFTEFDRRLALRGVPPASPSAPAEPPAPSTGVQSLLESFYHLLEERYRGTREEIKQRLEVYRNDWRAAADRAGAAGGVAIDIGCGRGELLELFAEDGLSATGVDLSDVQLEAARRRGCRVVRADALDYLRGLESGSVLAVSAIHVVEHIPFPALVELMQEVARVLKKGGVVILETPNPRNLIVGATTFHFDPTHIRPLPPEVTQVLLETVGFAEVEVRPLHPSDTLDYMVREHGMDRHLATLLFGPQDYAAVGVMA